MNLDELKARNTDGRLDRIIATLEKTTNFRNKTTFQKDETEWTLTKSKAGTGAAIIRFLPGIEEEGVAFIEKLDHGFKVNNRWFIENCPQTIGQACPACDWRWDIINQYGGWDKVPEDVQKNTLGPKNNKKSYWANILVISDPGAPENDGKVFKFRFGQKIYEKIVDKLAPEFETEVPIDVFDPDTGADFKLKLKKGDGGFGSYAESQFDPPSPIKNKKKVLAMQHPLLPIIAEDKFKSYDELSKKFYEILGEKKAEAAPANEAPAPTPKKEANYTPAQEESTPSDSGSGGDDDDYFSKLAEEIV